MTFVLSRRLLCGGIVGGAITSFPNLAFAAAGTEKRLVFIIQRGAADGLSMLAPVGDPALPSLRENLLDVGGKRLDSLFTLHPALTSTADLFASGEARAWHAVATSYRDRSHFDGQNMLESGASEPYRSQSGWIGRLLGLLPKAEANGLALAPAVPLALRGPIPVSTFASNDLPAATDDLLVRVGALYQSDTDLAPLWAEAEKTSQLAGEISGNSGRNGAYLGQLAASLLKPTNGTRVIMLETGGWDTHTAQKLRLTAQLGGLDKLLFELRNGLGSAWDQTLVIVATEFGRTAAANGTGGTDHGTASAVLMLGGALPPGKPVEADWPSLSPTNLYQGRDLRPTADMGGVLTRALAAHYGFDPERLKSLFV